MINKHWPLKLVSFCQTLALAGCGKTAALEELHKCKCELKDAKSTICDLEVVKQNILSTMRERQIEPEEISVKQKEQEERIRQEFEKEFSLKEERIRQEVGSIGITGIFVI